jgi:hypothetical protein
VLTTRFCPHFGARLMLLLNRLEVCICARARRCVCVCVCVCVRVCVCVCMYVCTCVFRVGAAFSTLMTLKQDFAITLSFLEAVYQNPERGDRFLCATTISSFKVSGLGSLSRVQIHHGSARACGSAHA